MKQNSIPVLSFFTGGGFLDIGFERAGFHVVWANEYNPLFADMYEFAIGKMAASGVSIKPNRNSIAALKPQTIIKEAFGATSPRLFGVVGGPPCPDFSLGGKHSGINGKNGRLTKLFASHIKSLKPAYFLIENVAGLVRVHRHKKAFDRIISDLRRGGYFVDWKLLNALEFGVPQDRERVFVFGIRKDLVCACEECHTNFKKAGWFPWPITPDAVDLKELDWPDTNPFRSRPRKPKTLPTNLMVISCLGRQVNPKKQPNGTEFFKPYSDKFWLIEEGDESGKSFKRLHRYRYSPTAWFGNNEVHLHPWEARRLSVREALRIQTVPDEYVLPSGISLTAKFKMIGNGVPCRMAEGVATAIKHYLFSKEFSARHNHGPR